MNKKEQLYNLLKETFILLDDGDRRLFNHYNLTSPRFYVLYHTHETPGLTPRHLSDKLLCDKSNVSRLIRGLENENLIERRPHETDRRSFCLYLTEAGTAVFQKVESAHKSFNTYRLDCLDSIAEGNLLTNLSELNQSLTESLIDEVLQKNGFIISEDSS